MSGNSRTGSRVSAIRPKRISARLIMTVSTGRWMLRRGRITRCGRAGKRGSGGARENARAGKRESGKAGWRAGGSWLIFPPPEEPGLWIVFHGYELADDSVVGAMQFSSGCGFEVATLD